MLPTIQFHNQPDIEADEIDDIGPEALLPPELGFTDLAVAQGRPQLAFGFGSVLAESFCAVVHDPSPRPSPAGKRELPRHFQILFPLPGKPSFAHFSVTASTTFGSISISRPHSRLVSGGHLSVASRPILEPRPLSGEAKSR